MYNDRVILHSDLNSFYASVEILLNPELRGKAVAVCGSTDDRHGIVLAKSESAKRSGVKTGMVTWEARRLCSGLIVVPSQYDQYLKYSKLTQAIYKRYTDTVEPFGMDECWLDVTDSRALFGSGMEIAEAIRRSVREELGLTVSIGVSFCKIFAKLGSDMKKPDAVTEINRDNFKEKVWPLAANEMIYCGRATTEKLHRRGIDTIGDVAACDPKELRKLLGINGAALWQYASGHDLSRVMPAEFVSPVKSIGHGITCVADLENADEVHKVILELCQDIGHRLRLHNLAAKGVQICVRKDDLSGLQYQCPLPLKTQLPSEIAETAVNLFNKRYDWDTMVRAVTVRAINLVPKNVCEQLTLEENTEKRASRERLEDVIESLRDRFGKKAVTYGSLLGDLKMPGDGRHLVKMPNLMYR